MLFKTLLLNLTVLSTIALPSNSIASSTASSTPSEFLQQGQNAYHQGQFRQALLLWEQAEQGYRENGRSEGVTGSILNQAQALTAMGMHRRSCKLLVSLSKSELSLCESVSSGKQQNVIFSQSEDLQAQGIRQLGETLRLVGNLESSYQLLSRSLASSQNPKFKAEILLTLGNTTRDLANRERDRAGKLKSILPESPTCGAPIIAEMPAAHLYQQAIDCYQKAAQQPESTLKANLNRWTLQAEVSRWYQDNPISKKQKTVLIPTDWLIPDTAAMGAIDFSAAPVTADTIYAQINLARALTSPAKPDFAQAQQRLETAIAQAKPLNNPALDSIAIGNLGWIQEQQGNFTAALQSTQQALALGNSQTSPDVQYQWEWQQGRILKQQQKPQEAIAAYDRAVQLLESARQDLQAVNPDAQFSLRDSVEPIYRELIGLQLQQPNPNYPAILKRVDALQLAELENFLKCKLQVTGDRSVSAIAKDESAAIIYPILLADRLEVIVSLPNQTFHHHSVNIKRSEFEAEITESSQRIAEGNNVKVTFEPLLEKLYDQIIHPVQSKLKDSDVKTLVFVLDGSLRQIPMGTLRNQQTGQYLIDEYPIAITPGLNILGAKNYPRNQLKALIGGLTKDANPILLKGHPFTFKPLPLIPTEVASIQAILPNSKSLLDQDFNPTLFQQEIQSTAYPIVHLATHGNFSSDPELTFVLTSQDQVMTVNSFQETLKQRDPARSGQLDLLVFSACQTAKGDRRATLGISGAAIRSGASSTMASLWSVNDRSTQQLMTEFYQNLVQHPEWTKAQALQKAQQTLKSKSETRHPYHWAPFILVGNWR